MAKSKFIPRKGFRFLSKENTSEVVPDTNPAKDDRLATLAVELGLAGAQVLQEEFGFTQAQATIWLDKMLDKAKVNRAATLAMMAVKEIDGD